MSSRADIDMSISNALDSLPPRPPTPPRETHHNEATAPSRHALGSIDTLSVSSQHLHTPPGINSPLSSATTNSTSRRARKRVGFSAKAEYKEAPVYAEGDIRKQHPTPVSLPRSATKPVKSILKVTVHEPNPLDPANGSTSDPADPNTNLAMMLGSTIQQLAGGDRDAKVDAYMMLTRAWKASNNLPDRVALQEKMGLFMQFMQRDIVAKSPEGNVDSSLVNHTLNLLITFLSFPAIATTITNDFGVFIIDHCIRSFEDASVPKDVARHLMQVIHLQNFSPKVMTSDRVGRLVSALHNIEEHVKGKSIIMSRVLIYRKLVKQSRQLMVIHSDWLLDLFTDMLSNLKDIRSSAIALGLDAAFSIGHEKQLSRKVMEVFNLAMEEKRYIEYYEERLKAMTKEKHDSDVVPQIWSVVILLLRIPMDRWEFSTPWLQLIQSCFNSSDFPTKIAANHAWSSLVYLMQKEERSYPKFLSKCIMTPLTSQLKRKGAGKTSEELRKAVLGVICSVFYYTFKPNTTSTLLDGYWESSVKPVVAILLDSKADAPLDNLHQASAILSGLFDCTTRMWKEDHIMESPMVRPEELPAIDSKWIRRNASRVFVSVEPILEKDFLALADNSSPTYRLWYTLVAAVASAASKEIKVSKDTTVFVAEALNALQKVWKRGPSVAEGANDGAVKFLLAARAFLEIMISSLGLLPFTEKANKNQGVAKAPLYTVFTMLSTLPPGVADDNDFAEFFGSVFAPFFVSKSDKAKMDLVQDLFSTIPLETPRPYGPWLLAAGKISSWLGPGQNSNVSSNSANETPVGHDYRDIVKVLERGIRSTPNLPWEHWKSLFQTLYERVREETGDAGVAIVAIEPLAKAVLDQLDLGRPNIPSANSISCVTELLSVASQPRDRQAVDAARRRLWGTVLAGPRSSSFDTFDHLYKAVNEVLVCLYQDYDPAGSDAAVHLLIEIGGFFDRCNRQLFLKSMAVLQDGFLPWLQDTKRLLGSQTSTASAAIKLLWDKLSSLIAESERPEEQLETLERLFCAAFGSSHRYIVNSGVTLWNRLFEHAESLDYPEKLKCALMLLQPHVDIVLPGLDVSSGEHSGQHPLFIDSAEELSLPGAHYTRGSRRATARSALSSRNGTPEPGKLKVLAKKHPVVSPKPKSKPSAVKRRNVTPRLRHDDSQVQFAAIEKSPSMGHVLESQVLTDRQREVRERQRENIALFPEIRSSPGAKNKDPVVQIQPHKPTPDDPRSRIATTPEPEGGFDDFVTSTPTPRRGQALAILDQDMNDPPSSPPEPRRNPLAAEIRSRSASNILLDDWQFSSSPVSGSPNPSHQAANPDLPARDEHMGEVSSPEVDEDLPLQQEPTMDEPEPEQELEQEPELPIENHVMNDVDVSNDPSAVPGEESSELSIPETPSTPPRFSRPPQPQETPKSEPEEYVDAPTSPLPPTPKRPQVPIGAPDAAGFIEKQPLPSRDSFYISDADERSLLRLVVELDGGNLDRSEYIRPSVSPEKAGSKLPSLDCIVVGDGPKKPELRRSPRKSKVDPLLAGIPSTEAVAQTPSSQPHEPEIGRPKRKRASSKTQDHVGKKRKQHDCSDEVDKVPDSQGALDLPEVNAMQTQQLEGNALPDPHADDSSSSSFSDNEELPVLQPHEASIPMDMECPPSDDHDVQSQIALESMSHIVRQEIDDIVPTSVEHIDTVEAMQINVEEADEEEEEEEREDNQFAMEDVHDKGVQTEYEISETESSRAPELNQMQIIMGLLRNGLDELRTARLSRGEVYQIEDMFMDMKRELYEAEKRGRA
ncbi:Rap1-interacting factor 1 N terminal-domain-containing protein [Cercophora scortea]|uniref:Rap1-interacting factor 1 N terminal-domain-containing protein n=1 Tax=Cercophora scortea TaxID=314031 RepID=A0AAE0ML42_9PEZI|nr:Rap1-interacting factor 1 N terminal-domain-containing protein [Cercophora scortea]